MKNIIKKILDVKTLIKWIIVVIVFVIISIYFDGASSFISSLTASFIISGLFYWLGIKPFIRPQFKEAVIFEIVTKFISYCGADQNTLKKKKDEDSIKAELLKKLFPETFRFIEYYESTFNKLKGAHNISSNYAAFVTYDELRFYKEATEKDKNKIIEARKKFIEKLNKTFYKDLKD